jgi:hypothetical protein
MKNPCPRAEETLRSLVQGDLSEALADHLTTCADCQQARLLSVELRELSTPTVSAPEADEDVALAARRIWVRAAAARNRQREKTPYLALCSPLLGAVVAIVLVAIRMGLAPASPTDGVVLTAGLGLILGSGLLLFLAASASVALVWDEI